MLLRIALPNGTLQKQAMTFFEKAGIGLELQPRSYHAKVKDPRGRIASVTFMRPSMIPLLVSSGKYDLGILGSDSVAESEYRVPILAKLNFAARDQRTDFRVVLLGGLEDPAQNLGEIKQPCTILSEYPRMTRRALIEARVAEVMLQASPGTTEAHIPRDYDYGVCVVCTGNTLAANGLKIIHTLSVETTVLIGGKSRLDRGVKEEAANLLVADLLKVVVDPKE